MMSFPKPGITLALDFPIKPDEELRALPSASRDMTRSSAAVSIRPRTQP